MPHDKGFSWGGGIFRYIARLLKRGDVRSVTHAHHVTPKYHVASFEFSQNNTPIQHVTVVRKPLQRIHQTYHLVKN